MQIAKELSENQLIHTLKSGLTDEIKKMVKPTNTKEHTMKLFKKKNQIKITERSNVIQFDDMGYPLRLVIVDDKEQIWIDTYEEEGDVVVNWKSNNAQ